MYILLVYMFIIVYIYLHLLPRTQDCVMAEARIPKFFRESQIRVQVLDFMGLGSCMPREAWRLPSPQMLHFEQERFRIVFFIRRLRESSFIFLFFAIIFFFTFNFHRSKAAWATLFFNILRGNKGLFLTSNGRW